MPSYTEIGDFRIWFHETFVILAIRYPADPVLATPERWEHFGQVFKKDLRDLERTIQLARHHYRERAQS